MKILRPIILLLLAMLPLSAVFAQDSTETTLPLPVAYQLQNVGYEAQMWNNCGPATITNGLTYFGYTSDQTRAQSYLKPNLDDKNVNPWEIVDFVNTQVPEIPVYALRRVGGTVDTLKMLLANNFPVMIEEGYDPPPHDLGWMGHYLLMIGYDDSFDVFMTHDSYDGANLNYGYEHIEEFWQHFNYTYIVIFTQDRLGDLLTLLGEDMETFDWTNGYQYDEANTITALNLAVAEASEDNNSEWAWFNIGTNYVQLAEIATNRGDSATAADYYNRATLAYDRARNIGLPWRMMWYQFGAYEAYYHVGRYDDMLSLAQGALNDGGGHLVEETLYYGGLAREAKGELDRALRNYNSALQINNAHQPSIDARDALQQRLNS